MMTVLPERGSDHMIDYGPLWETMQKKNISQYYLVNNGIDYRTMDQLRKNKNITANTIEKLCNLLDCTPNDILTFKKGVKKPS
jgi:DNA-binding Xre family transcriptional regulator